MLLLQLLQEQNGKKFKNRKKRINKHFQEIEYIFSIKDYIAQNGDPYGIFTNDTAEKNRETVKTFIKLPDDYDEMAGDENDSN